MATLNGRSRPVITEVATDLSPSGTKGLGVTIRIDWEADSANWLSLTFTADELRAMLTAVKERFDPTLDADGVICVG